MATSDDVGAVGSRQKQQPAISNDVDGGSTVVPEHCRGRQWQLPAMMVVAEALAPPCHFGAPSRSREEDQGCAHKLVDMSVLINSKQ